MNTKIPRFTLSISSVLLLSSIHSSDAGMEPYSGITAIQAMCVVGSYGAVDKMITISYYIKRSEIKGTLGVKIVLLNNAIQFTLMSVVLDRLYL